MMPNICVESRRHPDCELWEPSDRLLDHSGHSCGTEWKQIWSPGQVRRSSTPASSLRLYGVPKNPCEFLREPLSLCESCGYLWVTVGSSQPLLGPYRFLWVPMGPCKSLRVHLSPFMSQWFHMSLFNSVIDGPCEFRTTALWVNLSTGCPWEFLWVTEVESQRVRTTHCKSMYVPKSLCESLKGESWRVPETHCKSLYVPESLWVPVNPCQWGKSLLPVIMVRMWSRFQTHY